MANGPMGFADFPPEFVRDNYTRWNSVATGELEKNLRDTETEINLWQRLGEDPARSVELKKRRQFCVNIRIILEMRRNAFPAAPLIQ